MKVGAENRNKTYFAIGLLAVALLLLARWVFSSTESPAPVRASVAAVPAQDTVVVAKDHAVPGKKNAPAPRLDPTLDFNLLRPSEDTRYTGAGRNIFEAQVEIPQPIKSPIIQTPPPPPPGPPPPPPINLKFYGFASQRGEAKRIFLAEGEDVFIAAEGDIVDRRYKILHISPNAVEIEDVLHNNRQSIPLTQS